VDLSKNNKFYFLKPVYKFFRFGVATSWIFTLILAPIKTFVNIQLNRRKKYRCLEVGADAMNPVSGFESLSIYDFINIDYVIDLNKGLPFDDNSFDVIYASHVIEHIVWYKVPFVLKELSRVCKPGGRVEIWVPDGYKIAKAIIEFEDEKGDASPLDGYYECMPDRDLIWWANLRTFAHGDGKATLSDPNWHRAIFTDRFLKKILLENGFNSVKSLTSEDVRAKDHGWINLGVVGIK